MFNYYFKQNFKFGNTVSCTQENKAQNIFFALKCTHDTIKDQNSCILCHTLYMNTCYVVYPNTLPTYFLTSNATDSIMVMDHFSLNTDVSLKSYIKY